MSTKQFFSQFNQLSVPSIEKLENIFKVQKYSKGDNIAGNNQNESNFFFLNKGISCSFLTDKKGKNYIRTLFTPPEPIVSLPTFVNQQIVNIKYHCLTDCFFLKTNYNAFLDAVKERQDISLFYIEIMEVSYGKLLDRVTDLTTLNATERYLKIKKKIPDIENLIPQYHIASYLNITPVQLSRIRKKLYSR
ncbi:MAG: Crp/Fnr family transcriptional regulator [Polaribacter sp.]|uniref:Crp/Fnr family transcriptional regulator n=1 Tax=Polaribacter sp. TaxID=1920175 RepID=UPI002F35E082